MGGSLEQLIAEFGHPTYTPFPVVAARLLLAAIFGAAIGFEREWRNRPAGLRTHILVCVAAATFAILTIEIVASADVRLREGRRVDPIRVVEAVTAGVAFLAAGTSCSRAARCKGSPRAPACGSRERSASPAALASGRSRRSARSWCWWCSGFSTPSRASWASARDKKDHRSPKSTSKHEPQVLTLFRAASERDEVAIADHVR